MPAKSTGILIYSLADDMLKVFLVHPGGPFWASRDAGAWSIPKGEFGANENLQDAAKREVEEETGIQVQGDFFELSPVKLKSGKLVYAWALQRNFSIPENKSNTFEMEWPPGLGNKKAFPEIDRASWFDIEEAKEKINRGQLPLLIELESKIKSPT